MMGALVGALALLLLGPRAAELGSPTGDTALAQDAAVALSAAGNVGTVSVARILLSAGRNDNVVRYSLAGPNQPLAVADYTYDTLPEVARDAVPTETELAAAGAAFTHLTGETSTDEDRGLTQEPGAS